MITLIPWDNDAEDGLKISSWGSIAFIRDDVKSGRAQLWKIENDNGYGYGVTRVERTGINETELVLVAGEGVNIIHYIEEFSNIAKDMGINSVRAHVRRRGMIKFFERYGFRQSEIIMRKEI